MTTFTSFDRGMPNWVDVMVANQEQQHDLRAFLTTLFDWSWEVSGEETGYYAQALSGGAPVMGLGVGEGMAGQATVYFNAPSIDDALAKATELGASVLMPKMQVMELGAMAMLRDPAGATFGFWEPGTFTGFGKMHEYNAPGWFDHVSSDPARDANFYSALSGHQVSSPGEGMTILQNGDAWYASLSHAQGEEPATWKPIYVVDSLARIHETVPRHGGAILIESMPVPGSALCVFTEPVNGTPMTVMQGGEQPEA